MNLRGILPIILTCFAAAAVPAAASNVFVLPPGGQAGQGLVFSEALTPGGNIALPSGIHTTLVSPDGNKAIFLSSNPSAPVTFVTLAAGQVSGAARTIQLDATGITSGMLTPDGQKLVAIGGAYPGKLFIVDLASETVPSYGKLALNPYSLGTPIDFVVTQDSRYAVVMSVGGARLSAFNLTTGVSVAQRALAGTPNAISISPTGAIFITGASTLFELQQEPPFERVGYSKLQVSPGDLNFSPDGRYALAPSETGSSYSVILFDSASLGSNDSGETPSMGMLNAVPIIVNGSVAKPSRIFFKSNTLAMAYFAEAGRFFNVTLPGMSNGIQETSFPWVSQISGVPLVALSDEYPAAKNMYYATQSGQVTRLDLTGVSQPSTALAYTGPVYFGKAASSAAATTIIPYGAGQTVLPSSALKPYAVRVLDNNGRPVFNTLVRFQTGAQAVSISVVDALTNLEGLAFVSVTMAPPVNGEFTVTAEAGNASTFITSKVEGAGGGTGGGDVEGAPKILKISGDGQLKPVAFGPFKPLVVRVVDGDGNPIANREVTWSAQTGVVLQGNTTVLTDVNGEASVGWVGWAEPLFGEAYVTYHIAATVPGIGAVDFVETGYMSTYLGIPSNPAVNLDHPTLENPNITMKLGTKAVDAVQVSVFSVVGVILNAPFPNVGVEVRSVNQDPEAGPVAQCEGGLIFTQQNGKASCTLTVKGKVGSTALVVRVGDYQSFGDTGIGTYMLTVNPGDPAVPAILQGNNQSGKPGEILPTLLTIEVSDGFGNLMSGLPVTWTPQAGSGLTLSNVSTVTAANGRASARVQLGPTAGTYDVKVTVDGKEVIFKVTVNAQAAAMSKISGDNQTGVLTGEPFPAPLVVRVTDGLGNPMAGATVAFTVTSGQAAVSANSVVTGANGQASVTVTAGVAAGNITVTASIPNIQSLVFNLSSRQPGPSVTATSFRNYSTNEAGIAPGLLVKITGQGLTTGITGEYWANMLRARLPETMYGFKVEFVWDGGRAFAPVMAVSNSGTSEWALVQVPFELTGSTASAIVSVGEGSTTVQSIPVSALMPGIIEDNFDGGRRAAIIVRSDGLIVTPTTPARKGEVVRMYVIGMGQTTPAASTNRVGDPNQVIALPVQVGLQGGVSATVVEAKMAENLVGIYEILFEIPQDAPSGTDLAIACSVVVAPTTAVWSNESKISIQ